LRKNEKRYPSVEELYSSTERQTCGFSLSSHLFVC